MILLSHILVGQMLNNHHFYGFMIIMLSNMTTLWVWEFIILYFFTRKTLIKSYILEYENPLGWAFITLSFDTSMNRASFTSMMMCTHEWGNLLLPLWYDPHLNSTPLLVGFKLTITMIVIYNHMCASMNEELGIYNMICIYEDDIWCFHDDVCILC